MDYGHQSYSSGARDTYERLSEDEQNAVLDEFLAIGGLPPAYAGQLQPIEMAATVRVQNVQTLLTGGPFVDAKEHLGVFHLVDADNRDALSLSTCLAQRSERLRPRAPDTPAPEEQQAPGGPRSDAAPLLHS